MYFATDASLCRDSIGFWTREDSSNFWKRHFLVWPGEDALFYRRSINCFPDSRIRCRGSWPGALCSLVPLPTRRDCHLIGNPSDGPHQSSATPKTKEYPTEEGWKTQWILQCFSDRGHLQFWLDPLCRTSFELCFSHCSFWRRWCIARRSPDAGIYIRLGSAFLAFGLGF